MLNFAYACQKKIEESLPRKAVEKEEPATPEAGSGVGTQETSCKKNQESTV